MTLPSSPEFARRGDENDEKNISGLDGGSRHNLIGVVHLFGDLW